MSNTKVVQQVQRGN